MEDLGVEPSAVLFVDDTATNVEAARELRLNGYLFRRWGRREVLEEILRQQGIVTVGAESG